jgi:hypothetical protein
LQDLRKRNAKLLETVQATEASLEGKLLVISKLENEGETARGIVKGIVDDSNNWPECLQSLVDKISSSSDSDNAAAARLEAEAAAASERKRLEDEVVHYQHVLASTVSTFIVY